MEQTPPDAPPQPKGAEERAAAVTEWYLKSVLAALESIGATPSSPQTYFGTLRPSGPNRLMKWVFCEESGKPQQYGSGAAAYAVTRAIEMKDSIHRGLCLIQIESLADMRRSSSEVPDVGTELKGLELSSGVDIQELEELDETLPAEVADSWAIAVMASADVLSKCGLGKRPRSFGALPVVTVPGSGFASCFRAVREFATQQPATHQVTVSLTSVHKSWFRQLVWEEKKHEIRQFIDQSLEAVDLSKSKMPENARGSLTRVHELWQTVRGEVKARLEQVIAGLSVQRFETFEEKDEVAAQLNQLLDDWRFRAVSPSTGRAAYFQCRVGKQNPKGYFFFQDIDSESQPLGEVKGNAPRAPSQFPEFGLTDIPPDPRLRPPDHKPIERAKRNKNS